MLSAVGGCNISANEEVKLGNRAVVEANAGGIECGWVRESGEKLTGVLPREVLARGWKRIRGEQWSDHGVGLTARVAAGHDVDLRLRHAKAKTLIGSEEEEFVVLQRTAEDTSEIILFFGEARQALIVVEPVVGVEDLVAQVLECGSMGAVGAAASDDRKLCTRCAAVLGIEGVGLNLVLLHVIHRNQVV